MIKEYITPEMDIVTILPETSILSVSNPELEDFDVSDGAW